jgi:hypothetical protein
VWLRCPLLEDGAVPVSGTVCGRGCVADEG